MLLHDTLHVLYLHVDRSFVHVEARYLHTAISHRHTMHRNPCMSAGCSPSALPSYASGPEVTTLQLQAYSSMHGHWLTSVLIRLTM